MNIQALMTDSELDVVKAVDFVSPVDPRTFSDFEKRILRAALEIALNDIADSRELYHGCVNTAVEYDDLTDAEKALVEKHLNA